MAAAHGFTGKVHEMDAREGGGYRMSFANFATGKSHSFSVRYLQLKPNELIRHTDQFDDPNLSGEMQVTITQEGVPEVIPVEFCYQGWQESLQMLDQLVTPEIPDEG